MEINLDNQKQKLLNEQNLNLPFWDKVFWQNNKIQINKKNELKEKIDEAIYVKLNMLLDISNEPQFFEINEKENKELNRLLDGEIKALKADGKEKEAEQIKNNKEKRLSDFAKTFASKHHEEYKHLVSMLGRLNYEDSFKALILEEALSNIYKLEDVNGEQKLLVSKRKQHYSIASLPNFHEQVLEYIHKNAQNSVSFKELYKNAQEQYSNDVTQKVSSVNFEGLNTYGKGRWIRFLSKANDEEHFMEHVQELQSLVKGTPWCTKTMASAQLSGGDFYVFLGLDNKPHVAIKMTDNTISEVRGIKNGMNQQIEDEYNDVVMSFLKDNKDLPNGKFWLEIREWNKRLIDYENQIKSGTFDRNRIGELLNDVYFYDCEDVQGEYVHQANLKKLMPYFTPEIAKYYGCKENEILFNDYNLYADYNEYYIKIGQRKFLPKRIKEFPYVVVFGDVRLKSEKNLKNVSKLKYVSGQFSCCSKNVKSVPNLITARSVEATGVTNFHSLEKVNWGCRLYFETDKNVMVDCSNLKSAGSVLISHVNSQIGLKTKQVEKDRKTLSPTISVNLSNLKECGVLTAKDCHIENLDNLSKCREVYVNNSIINSLSNLKSVDDMEIDNSKIGNINNLNVKKILKIDDNNYSRDVISANSAILTENNAEIIKAVNFEKEYVHMGDGIVNFKELKERAEKLEIKKSEEVFSTIKNRCKKQEDEITLKH